MVNIVSLVQANPKLWIIIISFVVTLVLTGVNYLLTDRNLMRTIKQKQKALREEMKLHKNNPEKMMELNKRLMEDMPAQMKQSFKIMAFTFLPLILMYNWLRSVLSTTELAGSWIWWYIIPSIVFSIVLRKVFKLD